MNEYQLLQDIIYKISLEESIKNIEILKKYFLVHFDNYIFENEKRIKEMLKKSEV